MYEIIKLYQLKKQWHFDYYVFLLKYLNNEKSELFWSLVSGGSEFMSCMYAALPDQGTKWLVSYETLDKAIGSVRHTSAPATHPGELPLLSRMQR